MTSPTSLDSMPTLRYAIIGAGAGIAPNHIQALGHLPQARIAGMSDINAERGAERAAAAGCPFFVDYRELLESVRPDVVVICTSHPLHAPIALDCFAAGAHVLTEKPLAVEVAEADAMIAAAASAQRLLAVNFQQRFRPVIEYMRRFIMEGELGAMVRVLCVEPWLRTDAYYRSAAWRSTWRGEGGGVLMNQAPHTLDLLCHLVGMPYKVWGWTRTLGHPIESEDMAQAMLEYLSGAPGYLHINTVEAGTGLRLQIVGDRAALDLSGDQLTVTRFAEPLSEYRATNPNFYDVPGMTSETPVLPEGDGGGHLAVHRDLHAAIREGRAPRCDGREARMSLELANAIILSSFEERAVTVPLDRAAYSLLLTSLRAGTRR
ncbi:MAG: Gfo/Idh/MocA family protein [Ktedonobacterales bacterium]